MRPFLLKANISGIKNIEKDITLEFYNQSKVDKIFTNEFNVSAIYGENGSGKTAIVDAFDVFKNIILNRDYLILHEKEVESLINKKTNKFCFEIFFTFYDEINFKTMDLFSYYFEIEKKLGSLLISKEIFSNSKKKDTYHEFNKIFECTYGVAKVFHNNLEDFTTKGIAQNLDPRSSLASRFIKYVFSNIEVFNNKTPNSIIFIEEILFLFIFAYNIEVSIQNEDKHDELDLNLTRKDEDKIKNLGFNTMKFERFLKEGSVSKNRILKKEFNDYKKTVSRLCKFIKIFKSSLDDIKIDKKEDGEYYVTSLVFVYGKYSIDEDFESTGIKKLIKLFSYIDKAANGEIVIIDELDANICGTYLKRLVEFISNYGKGQLIFTCHALDPMYVLSNKKKSIQFLTDDGIVPWVKNGNYKPYNLYPEGMISGLPFNTQDFDFLSIFMGDNK